MKHSFTYLFCLKFVFSVHITRILFAHIIMENNNLEPKQLLENLILRICIIFISALGLYLLLPMLKEIINKFTI